jgi:hypothetical protein
VTGPFSFFSPAAPADRAAQEIVMAKSQKRSNRETKKPKKVVAAVVEPAPMKGFLASASPAKKKK